MPDKTRMTPHSLDPRAPWVISTHDLGRRAGSMRTMHLVLPAPADLAVGLIGVPQDTDIELDVRLEAVMEGVLVTSTARVPLVGECSRCLDPLTSQIEVDIQELYFYSAETALPTGAGGQDEQFLDGELLDLEQVFRDAVVLSLPLTPLCRPDCPGLCAECGIRLADAGPDHRHASIDRRWAALQSLIVDNKDDQEG